MLVKLHSKILETQNKIGKQDTDALIAAYKVLLSDASLLENGLEENIQDRIEKLNNFCNGTLLSSVRFKKLYGAIEQTTPKIAKQINSQFRQFLSILQRQCIVYTTYDDREDFLTSIDPLFSEVTQ
ncbi:MAG: hypothetical protein Q8O99_05870 [bacterium]|nr:hypothetical protein [bacterium]